MVGIERPTGLEVSLNVPNARRTDASSTPVDEAGRKAALSRARDFSPFLRDIAAAGPDLAQTFLEQGAAAAVEAALAVSADTVDAELRQRRTGVALTIALGDLAGEFTFEDATRRLSDFADSAIESALTSALKERLPGAEVRGITAIALGKLGSRELN